METKEDIRFIVLYSTDNSAVADVAAALDYNNYCLQATGSRAALARSIAHYQPDLLVVDTEGDPAELEALARFIESINPAPPVLLLASENARNEKKYSSLQVLHAHAVLIKPFCPAEFYERLKALFPAVKHETLPNNVPLQLPKNEKPLVLVVEDSQVQMNVLLRFLKNRDLDIITAADGHEALKTAIERVPDLVLLDVVLPGMDGFEVCRQIKTSSATSGVPVIIITTLNNQEDKLNSLRHGADDFITKPVDRQELLLKTESILRRKKQLNTLTIQASRDSLTGLYNRRYMDFALKREMMDALASESPLSLIMLDVDFFKHYNDTNGHLAGDEVLKSFGSILIDKLRLYDIVIRYGGEEFLVLLPKTSLEGAVLVAEKIHRSVEEYPFPHGEYQPGGRLTVSIGTATFPEHASDATGILKIADEALYQAKRDGRNCTRVGVAFSLCNGR